VGVVSQLVEAINDRVASLGPRTSPMGVALTPFCYVQTHHIFDHMETLGTARTPVYNEVVTTNQLSPFTYGGQTIHPVLTRDFFDLLDQKLLDITPYFVNNSTNWVDGEGTLNKWFWQSITNRPTGDYGAIQDPLVNPGWAYWKTDWWWTSRRILEHGYELPATYPTVITPGIDVPGTNFDRWVGIDFPTNYPYLTPAQVMTNAHIGFLAFPPSTNDEFGLIIDGGYDFFTRQPFTTNPAVVWEMTYAPTNGNAGRWVTHTIQPFKEFIVDSRPVWRTIAPSGTTASVTFDATGIALVNAIAATHQMTATQAQHVAASTGADVPANATWIEVDDVSGIAGVAPTGTTIALVYPQQHSFGPFPNFASAYDINERVDYLRQLVWTTNPNWAWSDQQGTTTVGSKDTVYSVDHPSSGSPWVNMDDTWNGMFPPTWGVAPWENLPSPDGAPWRSYYDAISFDGAYNVQTNGYQGPPRYSWLWTGSIDWEETVGFGEPTKLYTGMEGINWDEVYEQNPWLPGQYQIYGQDDGSGGPLDASPSFLRSSGIRWSMDDVTAVLGSLSVWTGANHETDFYTATVYTLPDYPIKFWYATGANNNSNDYSGRIDPSHFVAQAVGFVGSKTNGFVNCQTNVTYGPMATIYTSSTENDEPTNIVTYVLPGECIQTVGWIEGWVMWIYGPMPITWIQNIYYPPTTVTVARGVFDPTLIYCSYITNSFPVTYVVTNKNSTAWLGLPKAQDPLLAGVDCYVSVSTNISTVDLDSEQVLVWDTIHVYWALTRYDGHNFMAGYLNPAEPDYSYSTNYRYASAYVTNTIPVTNITSVIIRWAPSGTTNVGETESITYSGFQKQDASGATNATVIALPPLLKWDVPGGYKRR
jgi:hypothetical protein